jgi:hypothetical protein
MVSVPVCPASEGKPGLAKSMTIVGTSERQTVDAPRKLNVGGSVVVVTPGRVVVVTDGAVVVVVVVDGRVVVVEPDGVVVVVVEAVVDVDPPVVVVVPQLVSGGPTEAVANSPARL